MMLVRLGDAGFGCVGHHTPVANRGLGAGGVGGSNGHCRDVRGATTGETAR